LGVEQGRRQRGPLAVISKGAFDRQDTELHIGTGACRLRRQQTCRKQMFRARRPGWIDRNDQTDAACSRLADDFAEPADCAVSQTRDDTGEQCRFA
jgi:hypothetical protein